MDFQYHYTEEQERFRGEVVAWLDSNVPPELGQQGEMAALDPDHWATSKALRRKLGVKGWLAPTEPEEWGGGGLTPDHALVLVEELAKRDLRWLLDGGISALRNALYHGGTEEQKRAYLSAMARGEIALWYPALEPGAQLDAGDLGVEAFLEGDDFILTGRDTFAGYDPWPDYLWVLALTDPDGPPERSTATFLVPSGLGGIGIHNPDALVPGDVHTVTFQEVAVPSSCLIGEEGEGWPLLQSTLLNVTLPEYPLHKDRDVADLIRYACENSRYGEALSRQPLFQQLLMEVYINSQLLRIFKIRNTWMATTGQKITYHPAQVALLEKRSAQRLAQVTRDIMGIYALLDARDARVPLGGRPQFLQRRSITRQNPTGGLEVQAGEIARHLGLGMPANRSGTGAAEDRTADAPVGR
ncbi:MAG: acyl-CoA dehydrogenase family protein [Chloroflexi bacterium]|nr:acyl-CoA dehydrogenase family protein [Chloroflexota bacterium]